MSSTKYLAIYEDLKEQILNGTYAYDSLLPSEHECTQIYDASRNTIRRAMKKLEEDGLTLSRHGYGVRVIYQPLVSLGYDYRPLEAFCDFGRRHHLKVHTKLMIHKQIVVDPDIAAQSGFSLGLPLILLVRVRYIEEKPVIVEINMLRQDIFPELDSHTIENSLYHYLKERQVSLKMCQSDLTLEDNSFLDQQYLHTEDSVMIVRKHVYDGHGELIEYTESRQLPNIFKYHMNIVEDRNE